MKEKMVNSVGKALEKWRKSTGMTLKELSEYSGFSIGYLSKLERSDAIPSFSAIVKLSSVLKIDLAELFADQDVLTGKIVREKNIEILRTADVPEDKTGPSTNYCMIPLTGNSKDKHIKPFLMRIYHGKTPVFSHDAEELNYVVKGTVKMYYDGKIHILNEGDSLYYDSRENHSFENESNETAEVLQIIYIYREF